VVSSHRLSGGLLPGVPSKETTRPVPLLDQYSMGKFTQDHSLLYAQQPIGMVYFFGRNSD